MSAELPDAVPPSGPSTRFRVWELPTVAALVAVAAGLGLTALRHWRSGVELVGLGVLLAAGLRLALPARQAGLLVVRSRGFDAAVLLTLGFGLVVLASIIPTG